LAYLLLSFERTGSLRREDRPKTHLDGCETAEDVGAAGAMVGHEKLEEREREKGRAILERDFFFWVDPGQPI